MRQRLKRWINSALRPAGVQLVAAQEDERQALVDLLHRHAVTRVIDVGANRGQFAGQLLDKGYSGTICCIEPLQDAHEALLMRFKEHKHVQVMDRTAVGAEDGSVTINVAGNSVSSSVRSMLRSHEDAAPRSAYIAQQTVPLARLDTLFAGDMRDTILLKIDTQGLESEVLEGAEALLPNCKAVLIEMSAVPLYEGQELWDALHRRLSDAGFTLWNLMPDFRDPRTGQLLQFDGLYLRN